MTQIKMTQNWYEQAEKELLNLYEKRRKIIEDLRIAHDFGDLRENSEFDAARDAQNMCDKMIRKLENLLQHVVIVNSLEKDFVSLGSIVTIEYLEEGEKETFQIVSSLEISFFDKKISDVSPMGKALYGKKKNSIVEVDGPVGSYKVKIVNIQ